MNNPEATTQALAILRNGENFQWYIIPLLMFLFYIYYDEYARKNYKGIAAGLSLYMVHWFYEIGNALIQYFSGHALWTVPTGTCFLLLVGVCAELSIMFAAAGLVFSKLLDPKPKKKILGINNRLFIALGAAAFFSIFEIFLAKTLRYFWPKRPRLSGFIHGGARSPCLSLFTFPSLSSPCIPTTGSPKRRR